MIYLQPHSGLANRIRVIVSGLRLADAVGQELLIIWNKDEGLNCGFYELFEKNDGLRVKESDLRVSLLDRVKSKPILKRIVKNVLAIDFTLFDGDFSKYVWNSGSDQLDMSLLPVNVRNYYIKTCNEFYFDHEYLGYLKPVKVIRQRIEEEVKHFSRKTIGFHIRRTDNQRAIEESPLTAFIEIMSRELEADAEVSFFLATDDMEVEATLASVFPGKILSINKAFTRNSKEGIIGAMVDLYCLSYTSRIYGSFWSSFSHIAARIGNIPLVVVSKEGEQVSS